MLPIQSVLYEMLPRQNVTIRKCTIQNVTDPMGVHLCSSESTVRPNKHEYCGTKKKSSLISAIQ